MTITFEPGGGYAWIAHDGDLRIIQAPSSLTFAEVCSAAVECRVDSLGAYLCDCPAARSGSLAVWHDTNIGVWSKELNQVASRLLLDLRPSLASSNFGGVWGEVLISIGGGARVGEPLTKAEVEHLTTLHAQALDEVAQLA